MIQIKLHELHVLQSNMRFVIYYSHIDYRIIALQNYQNLLNIASNGVCFYNHLTFVRKHTFVHFQHVNSLVNPHPCKFQVA